MKVTPGTGTARPLTTGLRQRTDCFSIADDADGPDDEVPSIWHRLSAGALMAGSQRQPLLEKEEPITRRRSRRRLVRGDEKDNRREDHTKDPEESIDAAVQRSGVRIGFRGHGIKG